MAVFDSDRVGVFDEPSQLQRQSQLRINVAPGSAYRWFRLPALARHYSRIFHHAQAGDSWQNRTDRPEHWRPSWAIRYRDFLLLDHLPRGHRSRLGTVLPARPGQPIVVLAYRVVPAGVYRGRS